MIVLKNCRVLCTPKAGSTWISNAVLNSASHAKPFGKGTRCHHEELVGGFTNLPAIAFVRHPLTWYPSYWNHRVRNGWKTDHDIDECASEDFQSFMEAATEEFPGWLGTYFQKWIGTANRPAEFVGRYENLQDDIQRGLEFFGESFDPEKLRSTPKANVGNYSKYPAIWTESIKERVCESEHKLIGQYY